MISDNYDYRFKSELSAEYGIPIEQIEKIIDLSFKQAKEIIEKVDLTDKSTMKCFMFPMLGKIFISERKKDKLITLHIKDGNKETGS